MLLLAMFVIARARAQIGYKGQLAPEIEFGITQAGGLVGTVRLNGFLSERSLLGIASIYDKTTYDATGGDSFAMSQWLGELRYRYVFPRNRVVFMVGGGVLLGGERCDPLSKKGYLLPYRAQFIYGVSAGVSAEYIMGRHWALVVGPNLSYMIKTHVDNLKFVMNVAVKCYF